MFRAMIFLYRFLMEQLFDPVLTLEAGALDPETHLGKVRLFFALYFLPVSVPTRNGAFQKTKELTTVGKSGFLRNLAWRFLLPC